MQRQGDEKSRKEKLREMEDESSIRVYMTERHYRDVLSEMRKHPGVETGGLSVAVRYRNSYYLLEAADSGMDAQYETGRFARDYDYTEHLCNIIAEKYDVIPGAQMVLVQWHRHPGAMDYFSPGDRVSNDKFAEIYGGDISGLVTIAPDFKLDYFFIPKEGGEPVRLQPFQVDDAAVARVAKEKECALLREEIEWQERRYTVHTREKRSLDLNASQEKRQKRKGESELFVEYLNRIRHMAEELLSMYREKRDWRAEGETDTGRKNFVIPQELLEEMQELSRNGRTIRTTRLTENRLRLQIVGRNGNRCELHLQRQGQDWYLYDRFTGTVLYTMGMLGRRLDELEEGWRALIPLQETEITEKTEELQLKHGGLECEGYVELQSGEYPETAYETFGAEQPTGEAAHGGSGRNTDGKRTETEVRKTGNSQAGAEQAEGDRTGAIRGEIRLAGDDAAGGNWLDDRGRSIGYHSET